MNNYKLTIQYDGTNYCGWQIQDNCVSVQEAVVNSISKITGEKVDLLGSGRTDSGVHAWGQTANFKIERNLELNRFIYSLNSVLPSDISVKKIEQVYENFHSRFDAKKRSYFYILSKFKSPFYDRYSLRYTGEIDQQDLNERSKKIIGRYDFTSFCKKEFEVENKICNIYNIRWKQSRDLVLFFIEADRFLHGMVRTIIGTLLNHSKLKTGPDEILKVLDAKDREKASEAVPAKGLFLFKVHY